MLGSQAAQVKTFINLCLYIEYVGAGPISLEMEQSSAEAGTDWSLCKVPMEETEQRNGSCCILVPVLNDLWYDLWLGVVCLHETLKSTAGKVLRV